MTIRKGYSDGPHGQVHWRMVGPKEPHAPDLYCFHPAPFSSLAFTKVMPHLGVERRVIAPDYPGYGGSQKSAATASIEIYADAMQAVMNDLSNDKEIDLLGFHTGCLVAVELCIHLAKKIRKSVLIDVPAFGRDARKSNLEKTSPLNLTPDLSCLQEPWNKGVVKRLESQTMARAFEMFIEQLRPGAHMNDAFRAAFSYPWEERFPRVTTDTLIIATESLLLEPSRISAEFITPALKIERLDIKRAVLDEAAEQTANEVLGFLNAEKREEYA